mmetsp:Transcript_48470/g.35678  ORF Transcript_48470/g.35678 Transcript_48470/m.35678 type:complete len:182 (-) Transcript_48470:40-585(-)
MLARLLPLQSVSYRSLRTSGQHCWQSTVPKLKRAPLPELSVSIAKHNHELVPHPTTQFPPAEYDRIFAIIELKGKQHKITKDDVVVADYMGSEYDLDTKVDVSDVLLLGSKHATIIGHPTVEGAKVVLSVEEIARDKKVIALKFRRRKNSRRRTGHRRDLTVLRVLDIVPSQRDVDVLIPK